MQPNEPIAKADLARRQGDFETAAGLYEQILRADSRSVAAAIGLGISYQSMGRPTQALPYLTRLAAMGCDDPCVYKSLGLSYFGVGNLDLAIAAFRRESELDPTSAEALVRVAGGLLQTDQAAQAEPFLVQAIELDPDLAPAREVMASLLTKLGRYEEAKNQAMKAFELDPSRPAYLAGLVNGNRVTESDLDVVDRLVQLTDSGSVGLKERISLEFALGKAFEDLGRFEEAASRFISANALASRDPNTVKQPFRSETHRSDIDYIIAGSGGFSPSAAGSNSEMPVFIIGMMRSGTTLVEQILSCHPDIGGAGEVPFWIEAGPRIHHALTQRVPDSAQVRLEAKQYLALLSARCPGKLRVCDKLPQNYMNLGAIHATLPNARIIHCRREARDVCLSLFTTPFGRPPDFAYSAEHIGFAYREYLRLMEHWRAILPSERFLELQYEDLVADQESTARKMVSFLGLEWSEACRFPERNPRVVDTPSHWQVRQPVYLSSVGRWKRFANTALGGLIDGWEVG